MQQFTSGWTRQQQCAHNDVTCNSKERRLIRILRSSVHCCSQSEPKGHSSLRLDRKISKHLHTLSDCTVISAAVHAAFFR